MYLTLAISALLFSSLLMGVFEQNHFFEKVLTCIFILYKSNSFSEQMFEVGKILYIYYID